MNYKKKKSELTNQECAALYNTCLQFCRVPNLPSEINFLLALNMRELKKHVTEKDEQMKLIAENFASEGSKFDGKTIPKLTEEGNGALKKLMGEKVKVNLYSITEKEWHGLVDRANDKLKDAQVSTPAPLLMDLMDYIIIL